MKRATCTSERPGQKKAGALKAPALIREVILLSLPCVLVPKPVGVTGTHVMVHAPVISDKSCG